MYNFIYFLGEKHSQRINNSLEITLLVSLSETPVWEIQDMISITKHLLRIGVERSLKKY